MSRAGRRVTAWRKKRELTQSALARKARIGRVTLWRLEEGEQAPTVDTLRRVAKALKIPVGKLLE